MAFYLLTIFLHSSSPPFIQLPYLMIPVVPVYHYASTSSLPESTADSGLAGEDAWAVSCRPANLYYQCVFSRCSHRMASKLKSFYSIGIPIAIVSLSTYHHKFIMENSHHEYSMLGSQVPYTSRPVRLVSGVTQHFISHLTA
jgi:hypothetical protein